MSTLSRAEYDNDGTQDVLMGVFEDSTEYLFRDENQTGLYHAGYNVPKDLFDALVLEIGNKPPIGDQTAGFVYTGEFEYSEDGTGILQQKGLVCHFWRDV